MAHQPRSEYFCKCIFQLFSFLQTFLKNSLLCSGLLGSGIVVLSSSWFGACCVQVFLVLLCSGGLGSGFCWLFCRSQRCPPQLLVPLWVWGERNRNYANLCPKWQHPIPFIVHYLWPEPIALNSALKKELGTIWNALRTVPQTHHHIPPSLSIIGLVVILWDIPLFLNFRLNDIPKSNCL